jgi:hypothetical protein
MQTAADGGDTIQVADATVPLLRAARGDQLVSAA